MADAIDSALAPIERALPTIHARRDAWAREADRLQRVEGVPRRLAWREAERLVYGRVSAPWRENHD